MRLFLSLSLLSLACMGGPTTPAVPPATPAPIAATPTAAPTAPAPVASAPSAAVPTTYFTRAITSADLQGKTLRELSILRNTIFARVGQPFRKQWLHDYFAGQSWYVPAVAADESRLSDLDRQNSAFIATYEAGLSRAELLSRRDALKPKALAESATEEETIEWLLLSAAVGEPAWIEGNQNPRLDYEQGLVDGEITPFDDPRMLDRQLTVKELENLSRRDLRILRNLVYARKGREFKSELLSAYFERMSWYKADPSFTEARLTELDKRNVEVILSVENSLGGPLTDHAHKMEEGWFTGA